VPDTVRKILSGLVLALIAGGILYLASPTVRQGGPSVVGTRARDFTFETDGRTMRLSDLRGKVVVLNFWATWCPPCVEEMPSLNRLHKQLLSANGTVLAISVDDDPEAYQQFLYRHRIAFPTWRDPEKKVNAAYGTFKFPETYIIDPRGTIARKVIGPQEWDSPEWVTYLKSLAAD
jgi:peroxiredoxin